MRNAKKLQEKKRFRMRTIRARALTKNLIYLKWISHMIHLVHTCTHAHMLAYLRSDESVLILDAFLFPFLFHYDSWTHQTDQYHVNNNYSHHTSVCVSLFYFFNNQSTVLIFSNLFIVICFDLIWFYYIFYVLHW